MESLRCCLRTWFIFPQRPEAIHEGTNSQDDAQHKVQELPVKEVTFNNTVSCYQATKT